MQDYSTLFSHPVLDFMKNHNWEHILPEGIQSDFVAIFLVFIIFHDWERFFLLESVATFDVRILAAGSQMGPDPASIHRPGTAPKLSNPNRTARWAWGVGEFMQRKIGAQIYIYIYTYTYIIHLYYIYMYIIIIFYIYLYLYIYIYYTYRCTTYGGKNQAQWIPCFGHFFDLLSSCWLFGKHPHHFSRLKAGMFQKQQRHISYVFQK